MSKYYTRLSDGSFREDSFFWHQVSKHEPWNVCDTILLITIVSLIGFALIYGLFFAEVKHWPI
jgi:hypothetical protein